VKVMGCHSERSEESRSMARMFVLVLTLFAVCLGVNAQDYFVSKNATERIAWIQDHGVSPRTDFASISAAVDRAVETGGTVKITVDDQNELLPNLDTGPLADFWVAETERSISVDESVSFSDESHSGSSSSITSWRWDFDNDGTVDSTEQDPEYTYTSPGTYTVSLTVRTSDGGQDTQTIPGYIGVGQAPADPMGPPVVFDDPLIFSRDPLRLLERSLELEISAEGPIGNVIIRSGPSGATEPTVDFRAPSLPTEETIEVTLDGFVIEGGDGGAIRVAADPGTTLWVNGCLIQPEGSSSGSGVVFQGGTGVLINTVVRDWGGNGILTEGSATMDILNSTVYSNIGDGIRVRETSTVRVQGVIVYDNDGFGINCDESAAPNITLSYNDVYGNTAGEYNRCVPDADSISQAPEFLPDDYHLDLAASPVCIDAGTSVDLPPYGNLDIDDEFRPLLAAYDIGADEAGLMPPGAVCILSVTPDPAGEGDRIEVEIQSSPKCVVYRVELRLVADLTRRLVCNLTADDGNWHTVWTSEPIMPDTPNGWWRVYVWRPGNLPAQNICLPACRRDVIIDTEPPEFETPWVANPADCCDPANSNVFYMLTGNPAIASYTALFPPTEYHINPMMPHNDGLTVNDLIGVLETWLMSPVYYNPPFPPLPTPFPTANPVLYECRPVEGLAGQGSWWYWFNTGAMGATPRELRVWLSGSAIDPPQVLENFFGPGLDYTANVVSGFAIGDPPVAPRSGRAVVRQSAFGTSPASFGNARIIDTVPAPPADDCGDPFAQRITWALEFAPAREGVYHIRLVAEDRAGNVSSLLLPVPDDYPPDTPMCSTGHWATLVWDKTPPKTEITFGCAPDVDNTQVTYTYQLADGGTGWYTHVLERYSEDLRTLDPPGTFKTWSQNQSATYPGLIPGRVYRFGVLGVDMAGNIDTTFRTEPPLNLCIFAVTEAGVPINTTITGSVIWFDVASVGDIDKANLQTTGCPPGVIEVVENPITHEMPHVITVRLAFRSDPLRSSEGFQWRVEPPGSANWQSVASSNGFGSCRFPVEVPIEGSVSYTFSVRAVGTVAGVDPTPAVCTFVVRPRFIRSRGPGQEDETFTDPTPGQPFKYFREEPE